MILLVLPTIGRWRWDAAHQFIEFIEHGKRRPSQVCFLIESDNTWEGALRKAAHLTASRVSILLPS